MMMWNSTNIVQVLENPAFTEFEKFSHVSELLAPIFWVFFAILVFIFFLSGLTSVDVHGRRRLLLNQGPFFGLGLILLTFVALLALSFQFFPAIGWWILELTEKVSTLINR